MFGMDVLTWPRIAIVVLDFPIFPAVGNDGAQSVDFESENWQKLRVSLLKIVRGQV